MGILAEESSEKINKVVSMDLKIGEIMVELEVAEWMIIVTSKVAGRTSV